MFVHPEDDYDFVVKLRPAALPRYFQNVTADTAVWTNSRNDASQNGEPLVRPGFDPAEKYLDDLTVRKEPLRAAQLLIWLFSVSTRTRPSSFMTHWEATDLVVSGTPVSRSPFRSA
jgi:hypothetical protein